MFTALKGGILTHDGHTNMKFSISRDFRNLFGKKPMLSRSMYEAYRWTHDEHTIIPDAVTNDTRSGSFAYVVDANDMRRLDDVVKSS